MTSSRTGHSATAREGGNRAGRSTVGTLITTLLTAGLFAAGCTIPTGDREAANEPAPTTSAGPAPTLDGKPGTVGRDAEARGPESDEWTEAITTSGALKVPAEVTGAMRAAVEAVNRDYGGHSGIALSDGTAHVFVGNLPAGPAWSTAKVPVAVAALRANPALAGAMQQAIQSSDNGAAAQLWSSLGTPSVAGTATDAVLREAGDPTVVQTAVVRPGFSAFGQTIWSLGHQARFVAHLPCLASGAAVETAMGNVVAGQRYGLGVLPGSALKGGWGPEESGGYLVRQMGLVTVGDHKVAIAIAASTVNGSYESGQAALSALARGVQPVLGQIPAARC